jgi:hypothetical protein
MTASQDRQDNVHECCSTATPFLSSGHGRLALFTSLTIINVDPAPGSGPFTRANPGDRFMNPEFIVRPSAVSFKEEFGTSVALGDGVAIVGALNDAAAPGAAYIFSVGGAGASQRAKLTPSDSAAFDSFGRAVAIDGNYALVGAPGAGAQGRGQAYIFAWDGAAWGEQALLTASDGAPWGEFGFAVAIHGDAVIAGANGAAYVFRRTGAGWTEEAKLTEPPPAGGGNSFGRSVSLHEDRAIVGSRSGATPNSPGAAYVFHTDGTAWAIEATLAPSDPVALDNFGAGVAIDRDYLIVGAPGATSGGRADVGAAYVFERIGSTWRQQRRLEPTDTHSVNDFGEAVAIRGDYAAVGDPAQHQPVAGTGAAYVYRRNATNWTLMPPRIVPSDAGTDFYDMFAWFGQSVAVSRFGVLVGAPGNTDTEREQGAAYFYPFPIDPHSLSSVPLDFALFVNVLFGLIGGGGGVVVQPGSGPRPVDPEPFRQWEALPASKRRLIMGMALTELTSFIDDAEAQTLVRQAGEVLTVKAAARLAATRKVETKVEEKIETEGAQPRQP